MHGDWTNRRCAVPRSAIRLSYRSYPLGRIKRIFREVRHWRIGLSVAVSLALVRCGGPESSSAQVGSVSVTTTPDLESANGAKVRSLLTGEMREQLACPRGIVAASRPRAVRTPLPLSRSGQQRWAIPTEWRAWNPDGLYAGAVFRAHPRGAYKRRLPLRPRRLTARAGVGEDGADLPRVSRFSAYARLPPPPRGVGSHGAYRGSRTRRRIRSGTRSCLCCSQRDAACSTSPLKRVTKRASLSIGTVTCSLTSTRANGSTQRRRSEPPASRLTNLVGNYT
jgi:hypothetical protein